MTQPFLPAALLTALSLLGACQSPSTAQLPGTASGATRPTPVAARPAAAGPDSTAAVLAFTRRVNLAPAWDGSDQAAMEGFYGPDNYRMSFHFDSVWRDAHQLHVFHFQGRDRYKKTITPFSGTLIVTRLTPLPDTAGLWPRRYRQASTAYATFELREDPAAKGAGHCRGRATLDFVVAANGQVQQTSYDGIGLGEANPTKSCGLIFEGTWQDNKTGRQQPVAWANYYGVIVPEALGKLGLGMRMEEVDPRLAKYGWNTIMENDEWWAASPKLPLPL